MNYKKYLLVLSIFNITLYASNQLSAVPLRMFTEYHQGSSCQGYDAKVLPEKSIVTGQPSDVVTYNPEGKKVDFLRNFVNGAWIGLTNPGEKHVTPIGAYYNPQSSAIDFFGLAEGNVIPVGSSPLAKDFVSKGTVREIRWLNKCPHQLLIIRKEQAIEIYEVAQSGKEGIGSALSQLQHGVSTALNGLTYVAQVAKETVQSGKLTLPSSSSTALPELFDNSLCLKMTSVPGGAINIFSDTKAMAVASDALFVLHNPDENVQKTASQILRRINFRNSNPEVVCMSHSYDESLKTVFDSLNNITTIAGKDTILACGGVDGGKVPTVMLLDITKLDNQPKIIKKDFELPRELSPELFAGLAALLSHLKDSEIKEKIQELYNNTNNVLGMNGNSVIATTEFNFVANFAVDSSDKEWKRAINILANLEKDRVETCQGYIVIKSNDDKSTFYPLTNPFNAVTLPEKKAPAMIKKIKNIANELVVVDDQQDNLQISNNHENEQDVTTSILQISMEDSTLTNGQNDNENNRFDTH